MLDRVPDKDRELLRADTASPYTDNDVPRPLHPSAIHFPAQSARRLPVRSLTRTPNLAPLPIADQRRRDRASPTRNHVGDAR